MMKICLVNSFYYPNIIGGAEISVQKLAKELNILGNEVHILCTGTNNKCNDIDGIKVHRIKVNNLYNPLDMITNNIIIIRL